MSDESGLTELKSSAQLVDICGEPVLTAGACTHRRRYTIDTGASVHIRNKKLLNSHELEAARPMKDLLPLETGNGITYADKMVVAQIRKLGGFTETSLALLDDCPDLLSVGRLVIEDGFKFYWDSNGARLVQSNGDLIML